MAAAVADAARAKRTLRIFGNGSKDGMAGPVEQADVTLSTAALRSVLKYEPRDLTIGVEAGMPWNALTALLAKSRQAIPLDPSFSGTATVGGVVAANVSGPRRRLYGSARDMVIGMRFATLDGKLIETGGMVVKNVAGLDIGKLMIGSFGTLAAIVSVNFRVHPMPEGTRTFRWEFKDAEKAAERSGAILKSVLQPMAIDILKRGGRYTLLAQAGGSPAVLGRYARDLEGGEGMDGDSERQAWREIRQFTPLWLATYPAGAVVRASSKLSEVERVLEAMPETAVARAGTGVCHGYFQEAEEAGRWMEERRVGTAAIEFAPQAFREREVLWPAPGNEFAIMESIKNMFDPDRLLNRGRLYGRI